MRFRIVGVVTAIAFLGADGVSARQSRPIRGYEKVQTWARLAQAHTPGAWDDAARTIAMWPLRDLQSTIVDLGALRTLLAGAKGGRKLVRYPDPPREDGKPTGREREMHLDEVPAMLMIADDGWSADLGRSGNLSGYSQPGGTGFDVALARLEREVTRVMKLAAMLHADIAVLAPPGFGPPPAPAANQSPPIPGAMPMHFTQLLMVRDGRAVGTDAAPVHWETGRATLEIVRPDPGADPFVRRWYIATSAHQAGLRQYGYVTPQLKRARELLPAEPRIQFYSGILQENMAAPPVQVAVQSLGMVGMWYSTGTMSEKLEKAEDYLRLAVDSNAGLHDAGAHLGRVLGLLGRHDDAAAALRRAIPALTSDTSRYYAELFLGEQEQALGHSDAARASFERARALFPLAQSPLLALSQLAWQRADRAGALASFRELANLPASGDSRQDPWWSYDISSCADAPSLLAELRAAALTEKQTTPERRP